jgi:hypothetical protein
MGIPNKALVVPHHLYPVKSASPRFPDARASFPKVSWASHVIRPNKPSPPAKHWILTAATSRARALAVFPPPFGSGSRFGQIPHRTGPNQTSASLLTRKIIFVQKNRHTRCWKLRVAIGGLCLRAIMFWIYGTKSFSINAVTCDARDPAKQTSDFSY